MMETDQGRIVMAEVHKTREFDRSADEIWGLIGDFYGMHRWNPTLQPSEKLEGDRRKFAMGSTNIVERLVEEGERSYTYAIEEGPFPFTNYRSTLSVRDAGDGKSIVDWHGKFDPAEGSTEEAAVQIVELIYEGGLAGLEQTLSS
jgi:hypothetical protein